MKTNIQKSTVSTTTPQSALPNPHSVKGLPSRPDQVGTASASGTDSQPPAGRESRPGDPIRPVSQPSTLNSQPRIDFALRRANRQLDTQALLALLRAEAPRLYELAEVIGQWVWIQFTDKQPPEVTRVLAEFGFHWNNKRRVWQHPCNSAPRDPQSPPTQDPRAKYGSHFPADAQAA